jgi:hypothetical protein
MLIVSYRVYPIFTIEDAPFIFDMLKMGYKFT